MDSEPDLAAAAALVAEPARAELVLAVLADGPLTASELAARAGIARSTASGHLGRLVSGGFIEVSGCGRNRYYELSGTDVAEAIEALSRVAPQRPPRSLREATRNKLLREARTCYDHLAGRVGVAFADALERRGVIERVNGDYALGGRAEEELAPLGIVLEPLSAQRRPLVRVPRLERARAARRRHARRCPYGAPLRARLHRPPRRDALGRSHRSRERALRRAGRA